jgi:hypothetical protein
MSDAAAAFCISLASFFRMKPARTACLVALRYAET